MHPIHHFLRCLLLACASIFLASLTWLAVETIQSERSITRETLQNERTVTLALSSVPAMADSHLVVIEHKVDAVTRLASETADSLQRTAVYSVRKLDTRLASIQSDTKLQLVKANRSIAQVSGALAVSLPEISQAASNSLASISADVHQVAIPVAGTAAQLNEGAGLYLDCDHNPSCAYNLFQGSAKATERTMQAVAKAAPQIAESTADVAADVRREADVLTKPKRWWQKLLGYIDLAAIGAAHAI